jgi:hypothetical protein
MKKTLTKWAVWFATTGAMGCLLSGCAWQIGGDKKGTSVVQATRGQELIDLKKALDDGAISQDEYQAQKKKIMDK